MSKQPKVDMRSDVIPLNWPKKVEQCNVPQPFCIFQFKREIVQPYNFMMSKNTWEFLAQKNKLEFLIAVRFCMQFDINKINEDLLYNLSFHTDMYVKFLYYLRKHAEKEVVVAMAEFQSQAFSLRFKNTFAIGDLLSLKNTIDKLNLSSLIADVTKINRNGKTGTVINRNLFKEIFSFDYDPATLKLLANQGYYPDEANSAATRSWLNG